MYLYIIEAGLKPGNSEPGQSPFGFVSYNLEVTSSNLIHRASTQWNQPIHEGGDTSNLWMIVGDFIT